MDHQFTAMVLAAAGWCLACCAAVAENRQAEELHELLEAAWQFELDENPLLASRMGDFRGADRLGKNRVEDIYRRADKKRSYLERLGQIDREALSREDQINYDIFQLLLEDDLSEHRYRTYLMPISNMRGFHISFPQLPRRTNFRTAEDYENYIARLHDFRRLADEQMDLLRAGIEAGFTLPAVVLEGYEQTIEPHIVEDPTNSRLFAPFQPFEVDLPAARREELAAQAKSAIRKSVVPAYRDFLQFMRDTYMPHARGLIAASALPEGREFYRFRIRRFTTLDLTPEQVHQMGLDEVKRIRSEMEAVPARVDFDGTYEQFVEHLRTDPRFYAETVEQLKQHVALILKRADGELPQLFGHLPRMPYGLREIPEYVAPRSPTAFYQPPSGDGTQAGFYYLNTFDLKSRPLFEMEALALHEAVPGHHLQIALQQELEDLPPQRRYSGFTVFAEGWALYAERLGLEMGFYECPYDDFGRLSFEIWRACRLVVDTGIHYFGWSREEAVAYMQENTALSRHNIEAEVDRYIAWPGQALAYKVGELKIRQLREMAEQSLADRFDVRTFHDVLLKSGSVPLDVLEENVKRYLEKEEQEAEGN